MTKKCAPRPDPYKEDERSASVYVQQRAFATNVEYVKEQSSRSAAGLISPISKRALAKLGSSFTAVSTSGSADSLLCARTLCYCCVLIAALHARRASNVFIDLLIHLEKTMG